MTFAESMRLADHFEACRPVVVDGGVYLADSAYNYWLANGFSPRMCRAAGGAAVELHFIAAGGLALLGRQGTEA